MDIYSVLKLRAFYAIAFLLYSFSQAADARWPEFGAPDQAFLLSHHYIDTNHCPLGQGRLVNGARIQIKNNLCQTYCPEDWTWIIKSDDRCHDLESGFEFQHYDIATYPDSEGTTSYTQATAYYAEKGNSLFTLDFKTSPGAHWFCYEMDKVRHLMICANDI